MKFRVNLNEVISGSLLFHNEKQSYYIIGSTSGRVCGRVGPCQQRQGNHIY